MVTTFLAAAVMSSAWSTVAHQPFDVRARDAVQSTEVIAVVPQTTLYAEIRHASAPVVVGGGFVAGAIAGALFYGLNAARDEKAEAGLRPLHERLLGYDFDARLRQDLQRELQAVSWLKATDVVSQRIMHDEIRLDQVQTTKASGVLYVESSYSLSENFASLRLTTRVLLLRHVGVPAGKEGKQHRRRREADSVDPLKAQYRNDILVETTLDTNSGAIAANSQRWAEGDLLQRALEAQVAETARLVALDLQYERKGPGAGTLPVVGPAVARRLSNGTLESRIKIADLPPPAAIAATPSAAPDAEAVSSAEVAPAAEGVPAPETPAAAPALAPASAVEPTAPTAAPSPPR